MTRATWNGVVVAESDDTVVVEGNHYFPREAVRDELLVASDTHTTCSWKGEASYYSIRVADDIDRDAAWYYPDPKDAAAEIRDRVAFWRGVRVETGPVPAREAEVPDGASCDPPRTGVGDRLRSLLGPSLPRR
jgi:uncharacterized protein (DUF427 family)